MTGDIQHPESQVASTTNEPTGTVPVDTLSVILPILQKMATTTNDERERQHGKTIGTITFVLAFVCALFAASVFSSFERYYQSREELITDNGNARLAAEKAENALQKMTQIIEMAKLLPNANDPLQAPPDLFTEFTGSTRLDQIRTLNQSASEALREIIRPEPQKRRFGFSLITSAYAETTSAPEKIESKFAFLRPLLWFLMFAPAFACVAGFACVFNKSKEVVSFGTNLITSVMGYYFGAGVSLMTAMLS